MTSVLVVQERNIKNAMEKISKKSTELLTHFNCYYCKKWWSVGDAPKNKKIWYCAWCAKPNHYKKTDKGKI